MHDEVIQVTYRTMDVHTLLPDLNGINPSCTIGYDGTQ